MANIALSLGREAAKAALFDRKAVIRSIDRARRKALSKFGAFVRQRARSSIRSRKKISAPGSPPASHTGDLKRLIFFSYDERRDSVVIGPVRKNGKGESPHLLEFGGTNSKGRRYAARPFMRPAFNAELPTAPKSFKSLVR